MAVVGLEKTYYQVTENTMGGVGICVTVYSPSDECHISFPFAVVLTVRDGTAGMYSQCTVVVLSVSIRI